MKKIFLLACVLALIVVPVLRGQTLGITAEWTKEFGYGGNGTSDGFYGMVLDAQGNVYMNGKNSAVNSSAFMKRDLNGNLLWSKTDSFNAAGSGQGRIFYLESMSKVGYFSQSASQKWFITRNPVNGNLIEALPKTVSFSFAPYAVGDSIVAIETGASDNVLILDEHGNVGRQFSIQENENGYCDVRVMGNYIWLFGTYLTNNAFVAKYDFVSGQQLWRKNVLGMIQPRGDVDSLGNSYFACSKRDSIITNTFRIKSMRFDPSGNILWDKELWANPQWGSSGNTATFVTTISVSHEGIVAIGAQVQKNNPDNGWTLSYFLLRKASNGDSIHSEKFATNTSAQVNGIRQILFRTNGKMLVLGFQIFSANPGWLRQYIVDTLTGVNGNTEMPKTFWLSQNYPNPFNPTTSIGFSIPKRSFISLKIYDILGKEVSTLVNEVRNAGSHTVTFDGSNLSSGIYFYRIETEDFIDTKKMTLIK